MPKFLVSLPDGSEVVHELVESTITIGRLADNTMQIEDASVSSHHAELTVGEDGDYILTDIGSTNGTVINNREIAEGEGQRLQAGDRVRFGHIETVYESENPAEAQAMPEAEEVAIVPASSSVRPKDFSNASPFQTKKKKKDPIGKAIIGFAILAMVAFAGSVAMIFMMKSPLG
jgi:pSer/pThr/pTyr-binding forkhead associated (FHA) protein